MTAPAGVAHFVTGLTDAQLERLEWLAESYVIEVLTQVAEKYAARIEEQAPEPMTAAGPGDLAGMGDDVNSALSQTVVPLVGEVYMTSAGRIRAHIIDAVHVTLPPIVSEDGIRYLQSLGPVFDEIGPQMWAVAQQELAAGMAAGESIPQLAARVRGSASTTAKTATLVARSAVVSASNAGSIDMARATGLPMEKEWLATPDARTRPTHRAADGQRVPLSEPFTVGGYSADHPGVYTLPPAERYNCRCTQAYVIPDDDYDDESTIQDPLRSTVSGVESTLGQTRPAPRTRREVAQISGSDAWGGSTDPAMAMTVPVLRKIARDAGIPGLANANKRDLVYGIRLSMASTRRQLLPDMPEPPAGTLDAPSGRAITGDGGIQWARHAMPLEDTPPEGLAVRDLSIDAGYLVRHGRAFRIDGVSYLVETSSAELTGAESARVAAVLANLRRLHDATPEASSYNHSYAWVNGANPEDAFWAQQYGMPGFTSGASGGAGTVTFWSRLNVRVLSEHTFRHETGHNVDQEYAQSLGLGSDSAAWRAAVARDAQQPQRVSGFVQTGGNHQIAAEPGAGAKLPEGVSTYGQSSYDEDFAESFEMYTRGIIGRGEIDGATVGVYFRDLYPERAALLDKLFPDFARAQLDEIIGRRGVPAPKVAAPVPARAVDVSRRELAKRRAIAAVLTEIDDATAGGVDAARFAALMARADVASRLTKAERDALIRAHRGDTLQAELAKIAKRRKVALGPASGQVVRMDGASMRSREAAAPADGERVRIIGRGSRTQLDGQDVELTPTLVTRVTPEEMARDREVAQRRAQSVAELAATLRSEMAAGPLAPGRLATLAGRAQLSEREYLALIRSDEPAAVKRALVTLLRSRGVKTEGTPGRAVAYDPALHEPTPGASPATGERVRIAESGYEAEIDGQPVVLRRIVVEPSSEGARQAAATQAARAATEARERGARLETAARVRQAEIDDGRAKAELLAEIDELRQTGAPWPLIRERALIRPASRTRDLAAVMRALEEADSEALDAAMGGARRRAGLTRIGAAGELMPVDRPRMTPIGGGGWSADSTGVVEIIRPGYVLHRDDGDVIVVKARVDDRVSADRVAAFLRADQAEIEAGADMSVAPFSAEIDRGYDSLNDDELRLVLRRRLPGQNVDDMSRGEILAAIRGDGEPNYGRERLRIRASRIARAEALESLLGEAEELASKGATGDIIERTLAGLYRAIRLAEGPDDATPPLGFLDEVIAAPRAGSPYAARRALRALGDRYGVEADVGHGDVIRGALYVERFGTAVERIDGSGLDDGALYTIIRRPAEVDIAGQRIVVGRPAIRRASDADIASARERKRLLLDADTEVTPIAGSPLSRARREVVAGDRLQRHAEMDARLAAALRGGDGTVSLADLRGAMPEISAGEFDRTVERLLLAGRAEADIVDDLARLRGAAREAVMRDPAGDGWIAGLRFVERRSRPESIALAEAPASYATMRVAELRALATARSIQLSPRATKAQLVRALTEADASDAAPAAEVPAVVDYAAMKVAELRALATRRGVAAPPRATKAQLVEALKAADSAEVPDPAAPAVEVEPLPADIDKLKVGELRALAKSRGVTVSAGSPKAAIIRALHDDDARRARLDLQRPRTRDESIAEARALLELSEALQPKIDAKVSVYDLRAVIDGAQAVPRALRMELHDAVVFNRPEQLADAMRAMLERYGVKVGKLPKSGLVAFDPTRHVMRGGDVVTPGTRVRIAQPAATAKVGGRQVEIRPIIVDINMPNRGGRTLAEIVDDTAASDKELREAAERVINGTYGGKRVEVQSAYRYKGWGSNSTEEVTISGAVLSRDGRTRVGKFTRKFRRNADGSLEAEHAFLELDRRAQGSGFASEFNGNLYDWYRRSGVARVRVHADIDVGGYTWATQGFDFDNDSQRDRVLTRAKRFVDAILGRGPEFQIGYSKYLGQLTRKQFEGRYPGWDYDDFLAQVAELEALMARIKAGGDVTAYELSQLGRKRGQGRSDMWIGKLVMLGSDWHGTKPL